MVTNSSVCMNCHLLYLAYGCQYFRFDSRTIETQREWANGLDEIIFIEWIHVNKSLPYDNTFHYSHACKINYYHHPSTIAAMMMMMMTIIIITVVLYCVKTFPPDFHFGVLKFKHSMCDITFSFVVEICLRIIWKIPKIAFPQHTGICTMVVTLSETLICLCIQFLLGWCKS